MKLSFFPIRLRPIKSPLVAVAFALSFLYWLYLAATAQMLVVQDVLGYEGLGRMLFNDGVIAYFQTGPNREPLYPLLFSAAIALGQTFNISYQSILTILQVLILALSQFMLWAILNRLRVRDGIKAAAILYFGISPGIVNSALSGYSEIVTYPLILGIVLALADALDSLKTKDRFLILRRSIPLALFFVLLTLVKGVYEFVFFFFLLPLVAAFGLAFLKQKRDLAGRVGLLLLGLVLVYYGPITGYKSLNKIYNGNFSLTDRGDRIFFQGAAMRAEKLTGERLLSKLAVIPGGDFCDKVLGEKKCFFWTSVNLENFAHDPKLAQALSKVPKAQQPAVVRAMAREKVLSRPFQFVFLMGLDCVKLFFWESTHVGFVVYPRWLEKIFDFSGVAEGFRFVTAFLSLFAFFFVARQVWKQRRELSFFSDGNDGRNLILLFVLAIIALHIAAYSLCTAAAPRHVLPIAPLHLILISWMLEQFRLKGRN